MTPKIRSPAVSTGGILDSVDDNGRLVAARLLKASSIAVEAAEVGEALFVLSGRIAELSGFRVIVVHVWRK